MFSQSSTTYVTKRLVLRNSIYNYSSNTTSNNMILWRDYMILYLLQSTSASAFATTSTSSSSYDKRRSFATTTAPFSAATVSDKELIHYSKDSLNNNNKKDDNKKEQGYISFRMARKSDIPFIQQCNLATLPENYNSNFYLHHLRTWPELALVMEYIPSEQTEQRTTLTSKRNPFRYDPTSENNTPSQIIGYVLGKVDKIEQTSAQQQHQLQPSKVSNESELDLGFLPSILHSTNNPYYTPMEYLGHVTSLAIRKPFRRKGLAAQLMSQLHVNMKHIYHASSVGLHVRVSNAAATKLYHSSMNYKIDDIIKGYYQDGEDAFFMKKALVHDPNTKQIFIMDATSRERRITLDGQEIQVQEQEEEEEEELIINEAM